MFIQSFIVRFFYWLHGIFYVMPILITGTEKQKYDSEHSYYSIDIMFNYLVQ